MTQKHTTVVQLNSAEGTKATPTCSRSPGRKPSEPVTARTTKSVNSTKNVDSPPMVQKEDPESTSLVSTGDLENEILGRFRRLDRWLTESSDCTNSTDEGNIIKSLQTVLKVFYLYGYDFSDTDIQERCKGFISDVKKLTAPPGSWMSFFKFFLSYFFAFHMEQPLPKCDVPGWDKYPYVLGGRMYRWIRRLKTRSSPEHFLSFCTAVIQSKKGFPRANKEMIKEQERGAFKTMTSPKPTVEETITVPSLLPGFVLQYDDATEEFCMKSVHPDRKVHITRDLIERKIVSTVKDLFDRFNPSDSSFTGVFLPSCNANYNWGRNDLGAFPELDELVKKFLTIDVPVQDRELWFRGRISEYYGSYGEDEQSAFDLAEAFLELFEGEREKVVGKAMDLTHFRMLWERFYWHCFELAMDEAPLVQVVGLAEALKIRTISKGPPLTYFVLKPLQKAMWRHLQKFKNFELTGRPISTEWMNEMFVHHIRPGAMFHSGDYKAATDNLQSWASEAACDAIMDCWEKNSKKDLSKMRSLFRRSLTEHFFVQGDKDKDGRIWPSQEFQSKIWDLELEAQENGLWEFADIRHKVGDDVHEVQRFWTLHKECSKLFPEDVTKEILFYHVKNTTGRVCEGSISKAVDALLSGHSLYVPQRRGQLMGSITSFPVLCLVNFSILCLAFEMAGEDWKGFRKITDYPIAVNGDDCGTVHYTTSFLTLWRAIGRVVGLEESLGKSYDDHRFMTLNSTFYQYDHEARTFVHAAYPNMGILHGIKRSEAGSKMVRSNVPELHVMELGVAHHQLTEGLSGELLERTHRYFLYKHGQKLKKSGLSWYLPQWCGGIGLRKPEHVDVSYVDLKKATIIRRLIAQGKVTPFSTKVEKTWMFYSKFADYMRELGVPRVFCKEMEEEETWGQAFASFCYQKWAKDGYQSLYNSPSDLVEGALLSREQRRAERLWSKIVIDNCPMAPASYEELLHEQKEVREAIMAFF